MQKLAALVFLVVLGGSLRVTPGEASSGTQGSSGSTTTDSTQPVGQTGTWNLIFSDEFSASSLDRAKWTPGWFGTGITGPVNSGESACYDSRHVTLPGDGALHLRLDATANTCKGMSMPYTGGLVSSNGLFQFAYGYTEFRVYLPATSSGQIANWPGTWSDGQSWPADGENDTMEGLGGPACYHFHSNMGGPGSCAGGNYSGWHTYASNWQPGIVTYFYDGVKVGQITTGITAAPQYLILQYTINSSRVATVPNEMQVDYVRVWTAASGAGASWQATADISAAPSSWAANQTQTFNVGLTNTGTQTWPAGGTNPVKLDLNFSTTKGGSKDISCCWKVSKITPLSGDVAPGGSTTVSVTVTAPAAGGSYYLEAQLFRDHLFWFPNWTYKGVSVAAATWKATYAMSPPTTWTPGQTQSVSVTLTNTGNQTWNAAGSNPVKLDINFSTSHNGSHDIACCWKTSQIFNLSGDVAPGGSVTLTVSVTAPTVPRGYYLEAQLFKDHRFWFGTWTYSVVKVG